MITKSDCILLLTDLQSNGLDVKEQLTKTVGSTVPVPEVLKFINDNRQLDLTAFYEKIRKSYNHKKSNLYINIMKSDEAEPKDTLTTLSAMLTQILLFAKNVSDRQMFLRHARADEISYVLYNYFKSYDLINCNKLLQLIKADIKVCELISKDFEKY